MLLLIFSHLSRYNSSLQYLDRITNLDLAHPMVTPSAAPTIHRSCCHQPQQRRNRSSLRPRSEAAQKFWFHIRVLVGVKLRMLGDKKNKNFSCCFQVDVRWVKWENFGKLTRSKMTCVRRRQPQRHPATPNRSTYRDLDFLTPFP